MDASIIVTYRCPMRCKMCNIWDNPTKVSEEFKPELLEKLPKVDTVNITGGEPFVREDIEDIVKILFTKTKRIVFSTSGYYSDRIIQLARKYPQLGFRISIEGLSCKNDELRGRPGGFDKGLKTLLELRRMGVKDIGFGITVSNNNSSDMLQLYELNRNLKMEFATASFHNSFYFHKYDNKVTNIDEVCGNFDELIQRLMNEKHPKSWFRAFSIWGLSIMSRAGGACCLVKPERRISSSIRMGTYFLATAWRRAVGSIRWGNLHDVEDFMTLWTGARAKAVRDKVANCPKSCWMIGSASPVMKKYITKVAPWVLKNKLKVMRGGRVDTTCIPFFHVGNNDKQGLR